VTRKSFGSDTKEANFVKNFEKARKNINNWVDKRTRHKIVQMIGPGKYVSHNITLLYRMAHLKVAHVTYL
jgi:serine protease inhibitor